MWLIVSVAVPVNCVVPVIAAEPADAAAKLIATRVEEFATLVVPDAPGSAVCNWMNIVVTAVNVAADVPRSVLIHAFAVFTALSPVAIVFLRCLFCRHPGERFRTRCHFSLSNDLERELVHARCWLRLFVVVLRLSHGLTAAIRSAFDIPAASSRSNPSDTAWSTHAAFGEFTIGFAARTSMSAVA